MIWPIRLNVRPFQTLDKGFGILENSVEGYTTDQGSKQFHSEKYAQLPSQILKMRKSLILVNCHIKSNPQNFNSILLETRSMNK